MKWLVVLTLISVVACLPKEPIEELGSSKGKEKQRVLAVMASSKEVPLIHRTRGEIVPSESVIIQATHPARVDKVLVHEGQKVRAGTQVLRYNNELATSKLQLAQAETEEAEAAIDFEQYRADNRDALLEEEEISSTVYDMLDKKLDYERARVKRAKAEADYLQKVAKTSDIVSPIAGVVTSRAVTDQMAVVEGQVLMEIIQDDPVKLKLSFPEEFIPATYRGQLLQVILPGVAEEQTVKITEVGVAVDPLTKTFDVFAKLGNPDGQLKTGMQLRSTLVTDKKSKIISIPKTSVALRNKRTVVFRIDNGRAKQARVRLGMTNGNEVAVQNGLKEGDIIVLDPPSNLKDGDPVEIQTAAAE